MGKNAAAGKRLNDDLLTSGRIKPGTQVRDNEADTALLLIPARADGGRAVRLAEQKSVVARR